MNTVLDTLENIVKNNKKIGISISGGLDSTLLAYLLHDIRRKLNSDVQFKFFCVNRPDDSVSHAKRVIDYIDATFNQAASRIHVVGNGNLHHSQQVRSGLKEALEEHEIDILLTAITKNPEELLPNYAYNSFKDPDGTIYNGPVRKKSTHPKVFDPFYDITKEETVRIIKEMQLFEIPRITHTCTGSKNIKCNRCWQCCERAWAFAKNNFIDEGTM